MKVDRLIPPRYLHASLSGIGVGSDIGCCFLAVLFVTKRDLKKQRVSISTLLSRSKSAHLSQNCIKSAPTSFQIILVFEIIGVMPPKELAPMSVEELATIRDRIWRQAKQMDALLAAMEVYEMRSMDVPNVATRERSLKWLENYVKYAWEAFHETTAKMPVPEPKEGAE